MAKKRHDAAADALIKGEMDVELVTRLTELIYSNLIREDRFRLLFDGLGLTLQITLYALCMGVVIGVVIAVARIMKIKILPKLPSFM